MPGIYWKRTMAAVAALGLTAAACGGGGSESDGNGAAASDTAAPSAAAGSSAQSCSELAGLDGTVEDRGVAAAAGSAVTLDAGDLFFAPTCVTAGGGGTLEVTLQNSGAALHNISIEELGIDEDVPAGETVTVEVELPDTGTLGFTCKYHVSSGMVGAFVVES